MAEQSTVARPYAKAVFELAQESGALDAWSVVLRELAAVVSDPAVAAQVAAAVAVLGPGAGPLRPLRDVARA